MLMQALKGQPGQTWRDAEAGLFDLLHQFCTDEIPGDTETLDMEALRRLGYLAEVALYLLEPKRPERLAALAGRIRQALIGLEVEPLAAVPGAKADHNPGGDDIAAAWGISPGISLSRYKSEIPARQAMRP